MSKAESNPGGHLFFSQKKEWEIEIPICLFCWLLILLYGLTLNSYVFFTILRSTRRTRFHWTVIMLRFDIVTTRTTIIMIAFCSDCIYTIITRPNRMSVRPSMLLDWFKAYWTVINFIHYSCFFTVIFTNNTKAFPSLAERLHHTRLGQCKGYWGSSVFTV